jgi:hypothetical protein
MSQSWVSIFGTVEVVDGQITLVPVPLPPAAPDAAPGVPYALVRSNIEFEQGTVEFEAWLPDSDSRVQLGLGSQPVELYSGLNVLGAPYGFGAFRNGQWEAVAGAGYGARLIAENWYKLKLLVQGSNLDLYVNDVKVSGTSYLLTRGPLSFLLQSNGRVSVRNIRTTVQQPICFVVIQFTDDYNALYREVIKPTCEKYGYKVVRADDFHSSGLIIEDITRSIRECAIVIADVTPNNPNVFYEVGFAHGIGKPTILLCDRKREQLPFDISGFRTLFYDNSIGGKNIVEERLRKHLDAISEQPKVRLS